MYLHDTNGHLIQHVSLLLMLYVPIFLLLMLCAPIFLVCLQTDTHDMLYDFHELEFPYEISNSCSQVVKDLDWIFIGLSGLIARDSSLLANCNLVYQ